MDYNVRHCNAETEAGNCCLDFGHDGKHMAALEAYFVQRGRGDELLGKLGFIQKKVDLLEKEVTLREGREAGLRDAISIMASHWLRRD